MSKMAKYYMIFILGLVLLSSIYVYRTYFFNPITFKQDTVTYLPWSNYKNPLQVEYLVFESGWKIRRIQDKEEVLFLISELKKGKKSIGTTEINNNSRMINIAIRHLYNTEVGNEGAILLHGEGNENSNALMLNDEHTVELTKELKNLISKRLSEAK